MAKTAKSLSPDVRGKKESGWAHDDYSFGWRVWVKPTNPKDVSGYCLS
jgi:hypothetical protein